MAGRTPNRNTRRPASGSRRPAGNTRRAPQSTRRPSQSRRRTARRRSPSLLARPGFWLFICILIIVFILIFRGCGSEDMTEGQSVAPTDSISASGPVIMGNTEPATEAKEPDGQDGDNEPNNDKDNDKDNDNDPPEADNGGQTPSEPDSTPDNGGQSQTVHLTKSVQPGVYLIGGRSGGLPAGRVNIEVLSGSGCAISSDGELSTGVLSPESAKVTAVELRAGTYLSVSGSLNLKMSYISEPAEPSVTPPSVNEDSLMYELGSYETETSYVVMSEGGDLTPGFYQVEIYEGEGVLTVQRKSGGGVDYSINENNNYTVNYLNLSDGDRVTVKGCVMIFTEMKEG